MPDCQSFSKAFNWLTLPGILQFAYPLQVAHFARISGSLYSGLVAQYGPDYSQIVILLIIANLFSISRGDCQTPCYPDTKILNQSSSARPSLAVFNGKIYMVHIGSGSNDIYFSNYDGKAWSNNLKIFNKSSSATPALAVYNNKLYMVHTGGGSKDIYFSSFDGTSWTTDIKILNQSSDAAPALATYNGKLYMVHLGSGGSNDIYFSSYDGTNWTANLKIPNQSSHASPTMVAYNNKLYMVHDGNSSHTLYMSTFDGNSWSMNSPLNGPLSNSTPTIVVFNNNLAILHLGNSSDNLWLSSFIGDVYQYDFQLMERSSSHPVGAATLSAPGPDATLHIVHTGNGSDDLYDCIMPVAPAKPGELSFSNIAKRSVTINFQDNSDVEESYTVVRELLSGNYPVTSQTVKIGCPPAGRSEGSIYSFIDNGLTPGMEYRYTVGEQNFGGITYGDSKDVKTLPPQLPAAPSNLIVTATTANSISIAWKNNADKSGPYSATGYNVTWNGGNLANNGSKKIPNANSNAFVISNLIYTDTYTITVNAYNEDGSSASASVKGTTQSIQTQPVTGIATVSLFNCDTSMVRVWTYDFNNQAWQNRGTMDSISSGGVCSGPLNLALQNGHSYKIVAMFVSCGDESPDNYSVNCQISTIPSITGQSGGGSYRVSIP